MILHYGNVDKFKSKPWFMLELANEKTVEVTLRRLGKSIPGILRTESVEIFAPLTRRDLEVFELETVNYIFIRGSSNPALYRLKTVTGIVGFVTTNDTGFIRYAVTTPDVFVQELIEKSKQAFYKRTGGLGVGDFVRVADGETRDYCGRIEVVRGHSAVVRVNLKTRSIMVETPIRNLINLNHVPEDRRVFYYSPQVAEVDVQLIAEDLHLGENRAISKTMPELIQIAAEEEDRGPKRYSRQRTITTLIKRLISDGVIVPMKIAETVIAAIKRGDVKKPKNCFIIYCIIKDRLFKEYFKPLNPKLFDYRGVLREYGREFKFSATMIAAIDPELGLATFTLEPAKDGRSREARQAKKTALLAKKRIKRP
jgi:transcription antitermination factor NusG